MHLAFLVAQVWRAKSLVTYKRFSNARSKAMLCKLQIATRNDFYGDVSSSALLEENMFLSSDNKVKEKVLNLNVWTLW